MLCCLATARNLKGELGLFDCLVDDYNRIAFLFEGIQNIRSVSIIEHTSHIIKFPFWNNNNQSSKPRQLLQNCQSTPTKKNQRREVNDSRNSIILFPQLNDKKKDAISTRKNFTI